MFLLETPVWLTFLPFTLLIIGAYISAKITANTCDFKKSVGLYLPAAAVIGGGFALFGLPIVLAVFMVFAGFVSLVFFSNKIFYQ